MKSRPRDPRVRACMARYLRYGVLLGVAAGCVNVTVTVAFALLDGAEPLVRTGSLPRWMIADYAGGLIAGLIVGLLRGAQCIYRGGTLDS